MEHQDTQAWLNARLGRITASRFRDATSRLKGGGFSVDARKYLLELLREYSTGRPGRRFVSKAMEWGTEHEPLARAIYVKRHKKEGTPSLAGFMRHPEHPLFGGSPDLLLGPDGGLEIKCPQDESQDEAIEAAAAGSVPEKYLPQIDGLMWITGAKWWDFMSFDPGRARQWEAEVVVRVERDDDRINGMVERLMEFKDALVEAMVDRYGEEHANELLGTDDLSGALAQAGGGYDGSLEWSPNE